MPFVYVICLSDLIAFTTWSACKMRWESYREQNWLQMYIIALQYIQKQVRAFLCAQVYNKSAHYIN